MQQQFGSDPMQRGAISRKHILDGSRKIFNERGIGITIDALARELGVSKGKITNHFPNKDSIFLGVLAAYEQALQDAAVEFNWPVQSPTFSTLFEFLGIIMDIQFEYRCAMAYVAMVTQEQSSVHSHILENFRRNSAGISTRLAAMIQMKLLKPAILEPHELEPFMLAYVNLMTFWVVSATLYHHTNDHATVKHHCLCAVANLYRPFLTPRAVRELRSCGYLA